MTTAETEPTGNNIVSLAEYRLHKELNAQLADKDILPTGHFLSRKLQSPDSKYIRMDGFSKRGLKLICYFGDLPIEIQMLSSRITSIHWKNLKEEELWRIDESRRNRVEFDLIASKVQVSKLGPTTIMIGSANGGHLASATLVFNDESNPFWERGRSPKGPGELPIRRITQVDMARSNRYNFKTLDDALDALKQLKAMIAASDSFRK